MEIVKIVGIGIVGVIISSLLKKNNPEFSLIITLATGMILLVLVLSSMTEAIIAFDTLISVGLDTGLFGGVLKIIGIGYLTEYGASICEDYGASSVGNKIQLGGKLTIFLMSLPIIRGLIEAIGELV